MPVKARAGHAVFAAQKRLGADLELVEFVDDGLTLEGVAADADALVGSQVVSSATMGFHRLLPRIPMTSWHRRTG